MPKETTKRRRFKPGDLPRDHEQFVEWCRQNMDKAWGLFTKYLAESPYTFRGPKDPPERQIGRTRPARKFTIWLKKRVPTATPLQKRLFNWTARAVYHKCKAHEFSLKDNPPNVVDDSRVFFRDGFSP